MLKKSLFAAAGILALVMSACAPATPTPTPVGKPAAVPTAAAVSVAPTVAPNPAATTVPAAPASTAAPAAPAGSRPFAALSPADRSKVGKAPPPVTINVAKKYVATIKTSKGDIQVELDPSAAPQTVNNFIYLSQNGFYDGLTFHRVEPNFVIQGGDPLGTGSGGPGYNIPPEIKLKHIDGAIAMARQSGPADTTPSSGSQFYITIGAQAFLDNNYTAFGRTIVGLDVVKKIVIGDKINRIDIAEAEGGAAAVPIAPTIAPPIAVCTTLSDTFDITPDALKVTDADHFRGNKDASTVMIEYGDVQCPACAAFHPALMAAYGQISDTVKLVFRHYPLTTIHDKAFVSSVAVEAAGQQGKFWEMLELLYTKQAEWDKTPPASITPTLVAYAKTLGLDEAKFSAALVDPKVVERVTGDVKTGDGMKITGTPTVFLDGRAIPTDAFAQPDFATQFRQYAKQRALYKAYAAKGGFKASKPDQVLDAKVATQVTIKTSKGDIVIDIDPKMSPVNANSFLFLAQKNYFSGSPVQVNDNEIGAVVFGDPSGTGYATPGYECEVENPAPGTFDKAGIVGLLGDETTSSAQFFITYSSTPMLDGRFSVIGTVASGLDIVKGLVAPISPDDKTEPDKVVSVTVTKK
ncbi:MAG: peptidylprolyl isomerase [Thermoflexales bacterium]|nr:peptidylprolyl isomerase [Thermoflexales bacterium]